MLPKSIYNYGILFCRQRIRQTFFSHRMQKLSEIKRIPECNGKCAPNLHTGRHVIIAWKWNSKVITSLIFHPLHAILSPVTKPTKPRSNRTEVTADSRRKVIYLPYIPSVAFVRCSCKHARLTHCCAKMNRVFVTFHT